MATHEQAGSEPCRKNMAPCGREDSVGGGRANLVRRRAAGEAAGGGNIWVES